MYGRRLSDRGPSYPYNAGTKHVEFSPTRQIMLGGVGHGIAPTGICSKRPDRLGGGVAAFVGNP